jgi:hypothetical protein
LVNVANRERLAVCGRNQNEKKQWEQRFHGRPTSHNQSRPTGISGFSPGRDIDIIETAQEDFVEVLGGNLRL